MNSAGSKAVKNASVLMASQLFTWTLSLLLTVFVPRYLGAAASGEFAIAHSIWAVMSVLIGFGLDTLLVKEIARQPDRTPVLMGTAFLVRGGLLLVSCGLVALYIDVMAYSPTTISMIWIIGLSYCIAQGANICQAALQGLEAMHYLSIASMVGKVATTVLGISVVMLGYSIYVLSATSVVSALISGILVTVFLNKYYRPKFQFQIAPALNMLRAGFPYLLSGLGLVIYGRMDILIISSMLGTEQIGWYSAASEVFKASLFIPVVFTTALFPLLTRTYTNAPDTLPRMLRKSFDLMLVTSIPLGLGLFVVANPTVVLLFGPSFVQSGPVLALMGFVLIFTYQNVLISYFLISTDRQNSWTVVMIVAAVITIPLDLALVPWCQSTFGNGAIAGSLSFIITEFGMTAIGIWLLPKGSLGWSNVRTGIRIVLAGLIMFGATWWVRDMFIAIPVLIGAVTYIGMILILRVLPSEDFELLKQITQSVLRKLRRRETEPVTITGV
jgi:O-antigen/teichoic acid export membrane protein